MLISLVKRIITKRVVECEENMLLLTFLSCSFFVNFQFDLKWNSFSNLITFEGTIFNFLRLMTGNIQFRESILHMKVSSDTVTGVYMAFLEFSLDRPATASYERLHDLIHSQK